MLMFVKWKYTAHENIGVKVDRFLKIVWKISNLVKSLKSNLQNTKLSYQSGLEIYMTYLLNV